MGDVVTCPSDVAAFLGLQPPRKQRSTGISYLDTYPMFEYLLAIPSCLADLIV